MKSLSSSAFETGRSMAEIIGIIFILTVLTAVFVPSIQYALDHNKATVIYKEQALRYSRISTSSTFQKAPIGSLIFEKTFKKNPSDMTYIHIKTGKATVGIAVFPVSNEVCSMLFRMEYPSTLSHVLLNGEQIRNKNVVNCSGNNNRIQYQYYVAGAGFIREEEEDTQTEQLLETTACSPPCNRDHCYACLNDTCQYTCSKCETCDGAGGCTSICPEGYSCLNGYCVACTMNSHCLCGEECRDHMCVTCADGELCETCPTETPYWKGGKCAEG